MCIPMRDNLRIQTCKEYTGSINGNASDEKCWSDIFGGGLYRNNRPHWWKRMHIVFIAVQIEIPAMLIF